MKIAHLADLHIRTLKRHSEYLQFFELLYKSLREQQPDIIAFLGDALHQKLNISPSQIKITFDFLKEISSIAPLYLVLGNHDCNLCNPDELDPLSPLVENLKNYNITYMKKSDIYTIKEDPKFNFVVFSLLDKNDWLQKEHINKNLINIGLHHGMVNSAFLDNGLKVENSLDLDYFMDKVDYLMLGDLHEHQSLNKQKTANYSGACIQQSYGESREKGYLMWNITSKEAHSVEFIKIPSPCPFYTLELKEDLLVPLKARILPHARIRVLSRQLNIIEKNEIEQKIKTLYFPKDLKFLDQENASRQEIKIDKDVKIENLSDTNVQNRLITSFLEQYKLDEKILNKIYELNEDYNTKARQQEKIVRNTVYKLDNMKFDNMFSFGGNNEFNFSNYKGICGIFGNNASGKSSLIVDTPLYALFNRVSKKGVVKNDSIINEDKTECKVALDVLSEKGLYRIERKTNTYIKAGKKTGNTQVQGRTEVTLKLIDENDNEKNLTGETRADTDSIIENLFGGFDDFMNTSIAPQWRLNELIEKGSTERQKLIGKYFDIDLFQLKFDLANEDKKDIRSKLELYENQNFCSQIKIYGDNLSDLEKLQQEQEKEHEQNSVQYAKIMDRILDIRKKIINIKTNSRFSEQTAKEYIEKLDEKIVNIGIRYNDTQNDIDKTKLKIEQTKEKKEKYNLKELKEKDKKWIDICNEINDRSSFIYHNVKTIETINKQINKLKQYDCINNVNCNMLKELKRQEEQKEEIEKQIIQKKEEIKNYEEILKKEELGEAKFKIGDFEQLKKEIEKEEWSLEMLKKDLQLNKEKINSYKKDKKQKEDELKEYGENLEQIKKNEEYEEEIRKLQTLEEKIKNNLYKINANKTVLAEKLGSIKTSLEETKKQKEEYEQYKEKYEALDYYLKAINKEGIPRRIVLDNLNIINGEIGRLLSSNCNFTVQLEESGKDIEIYFCPEKGKKRLIELCSGFEKSISSILIRAALIGVSTLPRFNAIIFDESFENVSKENINVVVDILENLKSKFETIYIISHNEQLKDICDNVIILQRNDQGFSQVG